MEIIKHPSHEHVLSLSEKKRKDHDRCKACDEYCDEGVMIYSCRESKCRFNLHESCAKLPQELHNPLLHPHPLSLLPYQAEELVKKQFRRYDKCNACGNICRGFIFRCDECDFKVDVKCAFIRPAAIEEGEEEAVVVGTHHFSHHHQHPLLLLEKIPTDRIHCSLCGKYCSDPKAYGCLPCGFFLHPSCLKLPEEIFHRFHPYGHPLKCIKYDDKCNACLNDNIYRGNIAYFCGECGNNNATSFCLHVECASVIMSVITYEGHDHLLLFDDNIRKINCSACNKSSTCESYGGFRCLYCDFNLHLSCGPLPYTIQHKSHIHPLILTNCPIEDEKDCEPDEFYCDACEEQRVDPFLPIYYCKECLFVADFSCVISEVLSLLKGEHDGDVELRNPFGQFGKLIREKQQLVINPALTLYDIFKSLNKTEENELNHALLRAKGRGRGTIFPKYWDRTLIIFKGDKNYTQFMKFVDIGIEIPIKFQDTKEDNEILNFQPFHKLFPKEEVVDIGDYKITRKLAPILKDLLSKYGDVSAESKLSPKVKLYFFHMLCECIYSMIITKVVDITIKDLLNWWVSLETSKFVGFRIQFAFDQLKRVALAHFGLYAEKQVSEALAKLDTDIEALKREHERLTSTKSNLIEKCWRETSILKGGKAGVGLL